MKMSPQLRGCSMKHGALRPAGHLSLAIRMLKPGEAIPEGVKVPSKTMGQQWIVCQSVGVARRYGWGIAVGKDDVICPLAASPSVFAGRRRI